MGTIKVGSSVIWRGGFGTDEPIETTVTHIEKCKQKGQKYGTNTDSIDESEKDFCVFDLSNGHWAYGGQIELKKIES